MQPSNGYLRWLFDPSLGFAWLQQIQLHMALLMSLIFTVRSIKAGYHAYNMVIDSVGTCFQENSINITLEDVYSDLTL